MPVISFKEGGELKKQMDYFRNSKFISETLIPKVKRSGIGKLNNPNIVGELKPVVLVMMVLFCFAAVPAGAAEKGKKNIDMSDRHIEKYQFQDTAENEDAPKIPICKDFLANLKALGEPPMVCDRKFHAKFKQFTWPKWKKLDAWENRDLIYQIWEERFQKANNPNSPYSNDLKRALDINKQNLKEYISRGDLSIAITRVEIDDKPADVLQFVEAKESFPCTDKGFSSSGSFGRQHYIIDLRTRKVDFKATENSMQFGLYGETNIHNGDLFLYNGAPYAAFWYGNSKSGTMVIKGGFNDYCFIEYNATIEKGEKR